MGRAPGRWFNLSLLFPQQEPRGREGMWGWVGRVGYSCEVCQDTDLILSKSLPFLGTSLGKLT